MLDLWLIMALGFVGSFGHCAGMCGPLTVGFALSQAHQENSQKQQWQQQLWFHGLLNLGRLLSYGLVGSGIGALGSIVVAGGQLAGVDSDIRRWMTILTGVLLIWFGLAQLQPTWLPRIPLLHPILQGRMHERLNQVMQRLAIRDRWWTPALLGMVWGLIPCGFLYAAQLKAAATGDLWLGGATMLAFGLGTLPVLLGFGVVTSMVSRDRRTQLFRLGGWITLSIGLLMLLRTGEMVDLTGYAALGCLMLALVARPLSGLWSGPLRYRRLLGVGAFILSLLHGVRSLEHTFAWQLQGLFFLPLRQQGAIGAGIMALLLLTPLALTSTNRWQVRLGPRWRALHLLSVPALLLSGAHVIWAGSNFLGNWQWTATHYFNAALVGLGVGLVLLVRCRWAWIGTGLENRYVPPQRSGEPVHQQEQDSTAWL